MADKIHWRGPAPMGIPSHTLRFPVVSERHFSRIQMVKNIAALRAVFFGALLFVALAALWQDTDEIYFALCLLPLPFSGFQRAWGAGINQGGPAQMGIPSQILFPCRF